MSFELLLGIDLEDINMMLPDRTHLPSRVVMNTTRILEWLAKHEAQATFFTVGKLAKKYPELIREIVNKGHEIACHSHSHQTLTSLDRVSFQRDLDQNCESLYSAGASKVLGFRAPVFSMTQSTTWAYEVLKAFGFTYSSSVLPATKSLYSWPSFQGDSPVLMEQGILEIPMSVSKFGLVTLPFSGGVYLRVLPFVLNRILFKRRLKSYDPCVSYVHPYDFDPDEPRFMYPELGDSRWLNAAMYWNRQHTFFRLDKLMELGYRIMNYREFSEQRIARMRSANVLHHTRRNQ